jgi:hypothetical protein
MEKVNRKISIYFLSVIFLTGLVISCGKSPEAPPEDIINEAKKKTKIIIEEVKLTDETIQGSPELVKEYWDAKQQRYVLKYYIETVYGAAITNSPTAYIVKEPNGWKYQFTFDKPYDSQI